MTEPLETRDLLAFTKVVDARSVSRAARELGIPRATIGRRLQHLEESLGVRLVRRTTRSLALTEAGEALYRHAHLALDAVKQAEASARRLDDTVRGDLRISAPPFTTKSFYALINDFARRYPDVRLHVRFSTEHVDLQRDGYDVAVRGATALDPGLVARVLMRSSRLMVAAPAYLASAPPLRSGRDLARHRCLLGFARGELPQTHWTGRRGRAFPVSGALVSNDIGLLYRAAIAGHGLALLPEPLVAPALARGELRVVLRTAFASDVTMSVVYLERTYLPPQVRAFVDAVVAWARDDRVRAVDLWPPQP